MPTRQNTKLEADGAEFLVLGHLLLNKITSYKASFNFPGYDLAATDTKTHRSARIQVKSRWATDYDKSFSIKNLESDFVVHVALNRGRRFRIANRGLDTDVRAPEYFVFPINIIKKYRNSDKRGKVTITNIPNYQSYKDAWEKISKFLARK